MPHNSSQKMRQNLCGIHLKRLRLERRLTLTMFQTALEVDYELKLDRTSLGRIERGTRAVTDIELSALARLLNISETELLWGTATPDNRETMRTLKHTKRRYMRDTSAKTHSPTHTKQRNQTATD